MIGVRGMYNIEGRIGDHTTLSAPSESSSGLSRDHPARAPADKISPGVTFIPRAHHQLRAASALLLIKA